MPAVISNFVPRSNMATEAVGTICCNDAWLVATGSDALIFLIQKYYYFLLDSTNTLVDTVPCACMMTIISSTQTEIQL